MTSGLLAPVDPEGASAVTHRGQKLLSCTQCDKSFSSSQGLQRHIRAHTGEKPYPCPQCGKHFSQSSSLAIHLRNHTGDKPHQCPQCGKHYSLPSMLKRHIYTHTGEKSYSCPQCDKTFSVSQSLERHLRVHTGEKPYACPQCDKHFTQSSSLSAHLRNHTGEKPHKCPQCSKCFPLPSMLKKHIATHAEQQSYISPQCQKSSSMLQSFEKHLRVHTDEKPYACASCDESFSQSSSLTDHLKSHTGKKSLKCPQCNKCFSRPDALKTHVMTHSKKLWQSPQCSQRFSAPSLLQRHIVVHSQHKSHPCPWCSKTFCLLQSLQMHLSIHTEEKVDTGRPVVALQHSSVSFCQKDEAAPLPVTSNGQIGWKNKNSLDEPHVPDIVQFPVIPDEEIFIDDVAKLLDLDESNLPKFHAGYYGDTPSTLVCVSAASAIDFLSTWKPCFHPNITKAYGVTMMTSSRVTVVMELSITSLSHLLDGIGSHLSLRERLDLAIGCVSAVDYLHHQIGVGHGMLTCDYIFCSYTLTAKVLDPMAVDLINKETIRASLCMQDDVRQLGLVLLALFRGVVLDIDSGLSNDPGQQSERDCLRSLQCLMVQQFSNAEEILGVLEEMKKSQQYRQCPPKRNLAWHSSMVRWLQ